MADTKKVSAPPAADSKEAKAEALAGDPPRTLDLPEGVRPSTVQFPALFGKPNVEIAERSADVEKASSTVHEKVFVVPKADYDLDADGIHERNIVAVRQYMVNNGIRPDAKVTFAGEEDWWDGVSVALRYTVDAVPASIAVSYDTAHTVMHQDGPTPTELAEFEAKRVDRLVAARDIIREGTPEADRPAEGAQSHT